MTRSSDAARRPRPFCPECVVNGDKVHLRRRHRASVCITIWPIYSDCEWFTCPACHYRFVSVNGQIPELAAD